MYLTSQDNLKEFEIEKTLGLVKGNTVRARHLGKDIMAAIRNLIGGELPEYTKLLAESREQATDRMIKEAEELGADGIVAIRYTTSSIAQNAAELYVYGTAVTLKQKAQDRKK
ncbi:YbjQ family protein [bacterium]|nr:YbjQ family protein [bacterium]